MTTRSSTVKFKLGESQMKKLITARENGTAVTLRLNKNMIAGDGIPLALTAAENKKIQNDINISATRVKQGGFLPALLAALPVVASVLGSLGEQRALSRMLKISLRVKELQRERSVGLEFH